MAVPRDDMGYPVDVPGPVARVVSLVPSLTEAIACTRPEVLVGATDWCSHPPGLAVARVRGTKNPDRAAVAALRPDLVVANKEENRALDVRRLREAGIPVWVTVTESVPQALASLERLVTTALDRPVPGWLAAAARLWAGPPPAARARVAVPVWRDPWMVVGARTFTGDLVGRLGLANAFADGPGRYPRVALADIERAGVDLVLLPDEPYPFSGDDGPEAFGRVPTALVSGRLLTWYGPSLIEAHARLRGLPGAAAGPRPPR
ncbi:helical backbone metal receptor [Streptomonospora sp. S1-112]|uniref:Helical backbone metal receptor n=1 Tax=Streptomonospora mangrovi TaxID=2883123 RepID=A0A9X3SDW8_9ACTN|nr:helical backbone metal receptor [Streptomonospora mangrovi]MDA0565333.1 helical backbone metal receptor [Streptomonospora mangrovi]